MADSWPKHNGPRKETQQIIKLYFKQDSTGWLPPEQEFPSLSSTSLESSSAISSLIRDGSVQDRTQFDDLEKKNKSTNIPTLLRNTLFKWDILGTKQYVCQSVCKSCTARDYWIEVNSKHSGCFLTSMLVLTTCGFYRSTRSCFFVNKE